MKPNTEYAVNGAIGEGRGSSDAIARVIDFMERHYADDCSLKSLANIANLSPYYFIRVFRAETGKTPWQYLVDLRIDKARVLLAESELPVKKVGSVCGFGNPCHFSTTFRQRTGLTPSECRWRYRT